MSKSSRASRAAGSPLPTWWALASMGAVPVESCFLPMARVACALTGALGFVGLLRTWLHRDCAESAESMAVLADSLIRQGIMNGIPNLK